MRVKRPAETGLPTRVKTGVGEGTDKACRPSKDFLRHIANPIIARSTGKLALSVVDDIKKRLGRAEDKYRFSLYNGDLRRLADYLKSEDFIDLIKYLKALNQEWILEEILKAAASVYDKECPEVADKLREAIKVVKEQAVKPARETITVDGIARMLKMAGYHVERTDDGKVIVEEPNITVTIWSSGEGVNYSICKKGRVTTFDALMAKISKIREV